MSSCEHAHEDGAYVLGALSPDDRLAFERHLATCDECAQSVRELAGIPGLLSRVPVEIVDPDQPLIPVPDTLLPALVRRVRRRERRRTWVTSGLVGIAAAVTVGVVGYVARGDDDPLRATPTAPPSATSAAPTTAPTTPTTSPAPTGPSTAPPEQMTPVGGAPISGWLSMTPVAWGTRLDLECSYGAGDDGYGGGQHTYVMYVRTRGDHVERVASWKAKSGATMRVTGATKTPLARITAVEVRSYGEVVLRLT